MKLFENKEKAIDISSELSKVSKLQQVLKTRATQTPVVKKRCIR